MVFVKMCTSRIQGHKDVSELTKDGELFLITAWTSLFHGWNKTLQG